MQSSLALLSVYNKKGIVELGKLLSGRGYKLLSSGGTAKVLQDAGIKVQQVSEYTESPEVLGGRVKTLHPKIHAGILSRPILHSDKQDLLKLDANKIEVVVVNLYPFQQVTANPDCTEDDAIENIDIGGHTLIRAAAKNYKHTWIITDPDDYHPFIKTLDECFYEEIYNESCNKYSEHKRNFAVKALRHAAEYDNAILHYFDPLTVNRCYREVVPLKYGCNPSQTESSIWSVDNQELPFKILNGNIGYINVLDAIGSWQLVTEVKECLPESVCAASFKHTSPAGVAVNSDFTVNERKMYFLPKNKTYSGVANAYIRARGVDPMSSFGDFIAINETVDESAAEYIKTCVSDGIIAPDYSQKALDILKTKKNGNYIVLQGNNVCANSTNYREFCNGSIALSCPSDKTRITTELLTLQPTIVNLKMQNSKTINTILLGMICCKYTQSNSVVYAVNGQCIGIGAGQQSRRKCVELAGEKAKIWYARQHPNCLDLPFKTGLKRQVKINAVLDYLSGITFTPTSKQLFNDLFETPPKSFDKQEQLEWMENLDNVCLISDAFYPNRDNIDIAARYNVQFTVQPGGSISDDSVTKACDEYGIGMCLTGLRLFLH